jgi:hypothetical protein
VTASEYKPEAFLLETTSYERGKKEAKRIIESSYRYCRQERTANISVM